MSWSVVCAKLWKCKCWWSGKRFAENVRMQNSSKEALLAYLEGQSFKTVLDAPSGGGWLAEALGNQVDIDGVDLYAETKGKYRHIWKHDLDKGLPRDAGDYDLICCCEGLEHVGNPLLLLRSFSDHLTSKGTLVVTTPNVWYPHSRLQYFCRGFFSGFPSLADKVRSGTHMHIMPWSWPQLYVYFLMAGFSSPEIIQEPLSKPKYFHERLFALPGRLYCKRKKAEAKTSEEITYWTSAGSEASLLARHLIVASQKVD